MEIFKEFSIEATHHLPNVPEGQCRRLHGHSFRIAIHVCGAPGPKSGWVMDFADVGEKFQPLFETLMIRIWLPAYLTAGISYENYLQHWRIRVRKGAV